LNEINKILNLDFQNTGINEDTLKNLDLKLDLIAEESKINEIFFS
jgi:hypothetical protein